MRFLLLLALSLPAEAAVVAHAVTTENRVLNLHDTRCATPGWEVELVSTSILIFKGCWMRHPTLNGAIHIRWADGDESVVPTSVFVTGPRPSI